MFKINDRVRLKHDNKENPSLTVRSEVGGQRFLCISDCGQRMVWAGDHELEMVERNFDIKQAIREVLLSDEFMKAFAAAWMKTPIPLSNPYDTEERERIRSLADYPFGEPSEGLAIAPITGSESEAYYLDKLKKGEAK